MEQLQSGLPDDEDLIELEGDGPCVAQLGLLALAVRCTCQQSRALGTRPSQLEWLQDSTTFPHRQQLCRSEDTIGLKCAILIR